MTKLSDCCGHCLEWKDGKNLCKNWKRCELDCSCVDSPSLDPEQCARCGCWEVAHPLFFCDKFIKNPGGLKKEHGLGVDKESIAPSLDPVEANYSQPTGHGINYVPYHKDCPECQACIPVSPSGQSSKPTDPQIAPSEEWEKEFDNRFIDWNAPHLFTTHHYKQYTVDAVKDFIRSLLSSLNEKARREVIDGIRRWIGNDGRMIHDCEYGKCYTRTMELLKHLEEL